jgi:hypothetical protein
LSSRNCVCVPELTSICDGFLSNLFGSQSPSATSTSARSARSTRSRTKSRTKTGTTKRAKASHQTLAKVTLCSDGFTRTYKGRTTQRTKAGEKKVKPKPKDSRQ